MIKKKKKKKKKKEEQKLYPLPLFKAPCSHISVQKAQK